MPYFHNENVNLLFIHIPKTGGSSLEKYFSKKFGILLNNKSLSNFINAETQKKNNLIIDSSLQHITYETIMKYKDFFNIDENNMEIITVVRNPYERIISDLFFLKMIVTNSSKEDVYKKIKIFLSKTNDNHSICQYLFVTDSNKKLIPNIKILKTETLDEDMKEQGYIDFNVHDNCNKRNVDYYKYLNDDSIKLINEIYDYDFELFNYDKIIKT